MDKISIFFPLDRHLGLQLPQASALLTRGAASEGRVQSWAQQTLGPLPSPRWHLSHPLASLIQSGGLGADPSFQVRATILVCTVSAGQDVRHPPQEPGSPGRKGGGLTQRDLRGVLWGTGQRKRGGRQGCAGGHLSLRLRNHKELELAAATAPQNPLSLSVCGHLPPKWQSALV